MNLSLKKTANAYPLHIQCNEKTNREWNEGEKIGIDRGTKNLFLSRWTSSHFFLLCSYIYANAYSLQCVNDCKENDNHHWRVICKRLMRLHQLFFQMFFFCSIHLSIYIYFGLYNSLVHSTGHVYVKKKQKQMLIIYDYIV